MIYVANPIYDSVFKYLMEDERVAKTVLSALLKMDVVSVELRPHEYANECNDKISMFRIDFGARVRTGGDETKLILIELQKTWVETETLRFRQYLGAQYSDKNNIHKDKDTKKEYAYPMVTIYIMGHRVGDIDVPVLYVNHKAYDYDGREVTAGMPDPFVESLIHDSIIVQVPLLHGKINNRLDEVLSVLDQTKRDKDDPHLLCLDEGRYSDSDDMQYIVHRLTAAAANPMMRQNMNVEDEYYSAIEDRDTAIMNRDRRIREQDGKIREQDGKIREQDGKIREQDGKIREQDGKIREQNGKIKEQDARIASQASDMKAMLKGLIDSGISIERIAAMMNKSIDEIRKYV
jgi:major membrane immunogen (membrane-anchored lipoprotein)